MKRRLSVFYYTLVLSLFFPVVLFAKPVTVAVAPFAVSSESGFDFLKTGIIDLFSSRLAFGDKVIVVDKEKTLEAFKKSEKITEAVARQKAARLGVDFLVFGSLEESPKGILLESFVVGTAPGAVMLTFSEKSSQYESADAIMLIVNRLSQTIKKEALKLEIPEERSVKPIADEGRVQAHPDTFIKDLGLEEEKK